MLKNGCLNLEFVSSRYRFLSTYYDSSCSSRYLLPMTKKIIIKYTVCHIQHEDGCMCLLFIGVQVPFF